MFAAIFIPDFSLQSVLRHEPELRERPVALVDSTPAKPLVVQSTAAAQSFGVCAGLTPSQATARCAGLIIRPSSLAQEQSATEVLIQTAYAFSPNCESTAPGVCTMELKGLNFLSNEQALEEWAKAIREILAQFYIEATIGFAATPELALLAARAASPILILANPTSLDSFPISSLEPSPEILEILSRWGIRAIGELLALGRDQVTERLGPAVAELFNRVSPDSPRPLKLIAPPESFSEQMEFENEVETAQPLLFVLRRFIEQLSCRLELVYLVVAELHLQFGLSSGAKYERLFKIPAPTGNIETLFHMLQTHLETVRTDSPIISLRLAAKPANPEAQQFGLFESTLRDPNQFAETLAQLTGLCGADHVGTPQLVPSHKPDSFLLAPPEFNSSAFNSAFRIPHSALAQGDKLGPQLRRFRPPLPSQIEFREQKPSLLRSHVFIGPIVGTRGPFFSSGDWWDDNRWTREEWDVQTSDGSLFRIFRSSEGCFVEGIYD